MFHARSHALVGSIDRTSVASVAASVSFTGAHAVEASISRADSTIAASIGLLLTWFWILNYD